MSELRQAHRLSDRANAVDSWFIGSAIALAVIGVVMVGSASVAVAEGHGLGAFHYFNRHLVFLAGGLLLAAAVQRVSMERLESVGRMLLPLMFILLLLVFVPGLGHTVNGATRWIKLGISNFQVGEAVKLMMIVYLAGYLVRHRRQVVEAPFGTFKPLAVAAGLMLLLMLQPDFGGAVLVLAVTLGMVLLGGARISALVALGMLSVPVLSWAALSESYRLKRLTSFLDPWADPFADGFQLTQALIAIGRGEWFGVGLGASIQKLFYLPEAHTDFILAVLAEELGLFGVSVVLLLFGLLVTRSFMIGMRCIDRGLLFAGFICFGVAIWIGMQACVSMGVNMGVLPTKGLTLPLISSGGSSVLISCLALGLVLRANRALAEHPEPAEIQPEDEE